MPLYINAVSQVATDANAILSGSSSGSVSFFFRLDSSATISSVPSLFRTLGSERLFVRCQDSTTLGMRLTLLDGEADRNITIQNGRTYHIAITHDAATGQQRFYVNGNSYTQEGVARSASFVTGPHPLKLGEGEFGQLDGLQIDEPAIWDGYVLTPTEVLALRDRTSTPDEIGGGTLAWHLTLDGTDDTAVQLADPGFEDQSASKQDITTIEGATPTWKATSLIYAPPVKVLYAKVGTSGRTIVFVISRADNTPEIVISKTADPTIRVNGGSPITLLAPIWTSSSEERADLIYRLPDAEPDVDSGDMVTYSAPQGWVVTAQGPVDEAVDAAVTNSVGIELVSAFADVQKTMEIGYNTGHHAYWTPGEPTKNLRYGLADFNGTLTQDSLGWPTSTTNAITSNLTSKRHYYTPEGVYALIWDGFGDGIDDVEIDAGLQSIVTPLTDHPLWDDTDSNTRTKVYNCVRSSAAGDLGMFLQLRAHGHRFRNLWVIPPGNTIDRNSLVNARFLTLINEATCIRFMDAAETNNSYKIFASHLVTEDRLKLSGFRQTANIATIEPYVDSDGYFESTNRIPMLITTSSAHSFFSGQRIRFRDLSNQTHPIDGSVRLDDGTNNNLNSAVTMIRKINDTQFATALFRGSGAGVVDGTQAFSDDSQAHIEEQYGMPYSTQIKIAAAQPNCVPWVCVPHAADNDCVTAIAQECLANLPVGRQIRVEYSNEVWNFGFRQWEYARGEGALLGLRAQEYYADRSRQVHDIFVSVFSAAGRDSDVIRVFAGQHMNVDRTNSILNRCLNQGHPVDEFAVAPYWNSVRDVETHASTLNNMNTQQLQDVIQMTLQYGVLGRRIGEQYSAVKARFPNAELTCYEGSPEKAVPNSQPDYQNHMWAQHPRMRHTYKYFLQKCQDEGVSLFVHYRLCARWGLQDHSDQTVWPAYLHMAQEAGKGDGSDGKHDNLSTPAETHQDESRRDNVSVVAQAANEWMALLSGP